jgi:predicted phage terminase large subunit-like protein
MRATANPGGRGHELVKARFITPTRDPGFDTRTSNRAFYPATLRDNPHHDTDEYEHALANLPPVTRAQLLEGDWDITPDGRLFQREWFPTVTRREIPDDLQLLRYWDLASTAPTPGTDPDYTVGVLAGRDSDGILYVLDVTRARLHVPGVRTLLSTTAGRDGHDVQIWIEEEPGSSGKLLIGDLRVGPLEGYDVRGDKPTGHKIVRAEFLAGRAGDRYIKLKTADWNDILLDELVLFPDGRHDDQVDALTGAIRILTQHPRRNCDLSGLDINDELATKDSWYSTDVDE